MTKLSDTQAVILSAASQRDDGAVLPLPETLKIKGGAVDKVLGSLKAKGLIDHQGAPRGDDPPPLRITRAGLEAIGVEPEEETEAAPAPTAADTGATAAEAADAEGEAQAGQPDTRPEAAATRTPRAGTKQAQMIEMLKRPEGATVEQIAAATGWHTIPSAAPSAAPSRRSSG
jgi:predicted ArsR family transcriptional regulator